MQSYLTIQHLQGIRHFHIPRGRIGKFDDVIPHSQEFAFFTCGHAKLLELSQLTLISAEDRQLLNWRDSIIYLTLLTYF
jgi:hypothetical protein